MALGTGGQGQIKKVQPPGHCGYVRCMNCSSPGVHGGWSCVCSIGEQWFEG
jgi:hypothetical protein